MKTVKQNVVKMAALLALTSSAFLATAADKVIHEDDFATLRGTAITSEPTPPPLKNEVDHKGTFGRAFPTQAPVVPHKVRKYQVNLKVNQCLSCHDRSRIKESKAPMVSVTHYMTRENHFLAQVSPRRYFCTQCHVAQDEAKPLVPNVFIDVDKLLEAAEAKKSAEH
ncbi:nitrate reductase cytochrome c-type subunit [Parashewanella curva]|uniref:Periplasmic nitrate reductase, electron transfer subunit n=1 Tax=Parashewanella curva TaxID=2338552 RepID=A0A3L8PTF4_9GAMM|nr:nitrate reductase cytochrome c-type subunit [Parashewanella curva]RLV58697.1 nitrate reductase cytochrome c-type subunit [Parashewanella curva]